ncbi:MAG: helix-turn-helix domain-containing protein [Ilumatobacteraceae bacterium]
MKAPVKPPRPVPPPGREQARTRLARRAVVDAARTLFVAGGYTTTSIEAISQLADVPQATVYRLFGSKRGILKALLDQSIAGDDQARAVNERPDIAALFAEPDAAKLLAGFAGVTTAINQRSHDVYRLLLSAADSDPAAAELLDELNQQRLQGQSEIARALQDHGSLRAGLTPRHAADLVHTLMSPEVFRLLVIDRRWSPDRYRQWLAATLVQQLT